MNDLKTKGEVFTSKYYRGEILHYMSTLDMMMNIYIAKYFCPNNDDSMNEMIHVILGDDRFGTSSKVQAFYYLASKKDKVWYDSYVSPRDENSRKPKFNLNKDLIYLVEERNVFAHRIIDGGLFIKDVPMAEGALRFAKFKNGIHHKDYTPEEFLDLLVLINTVIQFFRERLEQLI